MAAQVTAGTRQGAPTDCALSSGFAAAAGAGAVPRFAGNATGAVRFPTVTAQVAAAACAPAPACVAAAKSAGLSGNVTVAAAPGASVTFWNPLQGGRVASFKVSMGSRCRGRPGLLAVQRAPQPDMFVPRRNHIPTTDSRGNGSWL